MSAEACGSNKRHIFFMRSSSCFENSLIIYEPNSLLKHRSIKRHVLEHACFSCMLISSPHKLKLCSDSQATCFLRNVFEAVQKSRSTSFIRSKTTRLRLMVLNPIKHSCSFFNHYLSLVSISLYLSYLSCLSYEKNS